ncbi:MAG: aminoglycoside phosphotransferase family protein [Desulfobacterales bacterium]|jgi:hypothetical protein|nr:aminoglycoside phosphotransferase family protein [Desulfobacterales bacterium]
MSKHTNNTVLTALKIAGFMCLERITRPKARRIEDVPCSVEAITPEWLTAALCKDVPGARVTRMDITGSSTGTHTRHRLKLTYNDEGLKANLPKSIFTKSLPTLTNRMIGGFNNTSLVEGRFFTEIRPLLNIEAPIGYHAAFDRRSFAAVLLMEDLVATKNATFCNYKTNVTREMAEDMIDLLALLHARFYGDQTLETRFRWLADYQTWFKIGAKKMRVEYYTDKAFDEAAHMIPGDLMARRHEVWPAIMKGLTIHGAHPKCLLHSDVHIGNWYQTGAGKMALCDWQCASKGHWARDVAFAVSAGLTTENRRAWEKDLLARYLDRLHEHTGVRLDLNQSWNLYRQQILQAFWNWTITLCHSPLLPNMQTEETTLTNIQRIAAAISDLGCLDSF